MGIALFDSQWSDFTSTKTGPSAILVGEYVAAFRRGPAGGAVLLAGGLAVAATLTVPTRIAGVRAFLNTPRAGARAMSQLWPAGHLWFDGAWPHDPTPGAHALLAMIRELQPGILINNRTGLQGDFDTPEQLHAPGRASAPGKPALRPRNAGGGIISATGCGRRPRR